MSTSRVFTYDNLPVGFAPDAIPLGSMITNVHDPLENILRPNPALDASFVSDVSGTSYSRLRTKTSSFSISAFFTKIFTCSGNTAFTNQNSLDADTQIVRQLSNYQSAFKTVSTQSADAQAWIQTQVSLGRYVLLVVRVFEYTGATRASQTAAAKSGSASVEVPLTPAAGGTAVETATGGATDAGASVSGSSGDNQTVKYQAAGPRVYGLSFRLVETSWLPDSDEGAEKEGRIADGDASSDEGTVVVPPAKAEVAQSLFSLAFLGRGGKKDGEQGKQQRLRLKLASQDTSAQELRSRNVQEHVFRV